MAAFMEWTDKTLFDEQGRISIPEIRSVRLDDGSQEAVYIPEGGEKVWSIAPSGEYVLVSKDGVISCRSTRRQELQWEQRGVTPVHRDYPSRPVRWFCDGKAERVAIVEGGGVLWVGSARSGISDTVLCCCPSEKPVSGD
jgi:hypothetical protein